MGLEVAAWAAVALSGATALAQNVRANRAKQQVSKASLKAPSSEINRTKTEDKVSLGSDRADKKGRRTGRRQLMASKASTTATSPTGSTGLQL